MFFFLCICSFKFWVCDEVAHRKTSWAKSTQHFFVSLFTCFLPLRAEVSGFYSLVALDLPHQQGFAKAHHQDLVHSRHLLTAAFTRAVCVTLQLTFQLLPAMTWRVIAGHRAGVPWAHLYSPSTWFPHSWEWEGCLPHRWLWEITNQWSDCLAYGWMSRAI